MVQQMFLHRAGSKGYVSHGETHGDNAWSCLIHILIASIKSNIHNFRHANEQEAELDFSLPIKFSNVERSKQSTVDPNITPRCYKH